MRLVLVGLLSFATLLVPRSARAQLYETVGVRAQGLGGAFVAVTGALFVWVSKAAER